MRIRILAAAALAVAAVSTGSAHAACAGTQMTVVLCAEINRAGIPRVDPDGNSIDDCVYLGTGQCTPVSVPVPTVTPGSGLPVTVTCSSYFLSC